MASFPPNGIYRRAVCILCKHISIMWADFLNTFKEHDVFMMVDKKTDEFDDIEKKYPQIHFIQIHERLCEKTNFYNSSVSANMPYIIAWDKAIFFFCKLATYYDYVWFIENDVYFQSENQLTFFDQDPLYSTADLLVKDHIVNATGNIKEGWDHWINIQNQIPIPWAHSLVCIIRISRKLLDEVERFIYKRPFIFIEALFNTIAEQQNMTILCPIEFRSILYDEKWYDETVIHYTNFFFHPIKDEKRHIHFRSIQQIKPLSFE